MPERRGVIFNLGSKNLEEERKKKDRKKPPTYPRPVFRFCSHINAQNFPTRMLSFEKLFCFTLKRQIDSA
jgi:hypothetical protein